MSGFTTPANAETRYMHILQLNDLTQNPASSTLITVDLASRIFHLAKSARDVSLYLMSKGVKATRDPYVKDIIDKAQDKFPDKQTAQNLTILLTALINPLEAYPQKVEKVFLLAIRTLTHSLDACRALTRPLTRRPKRDSPAFSQLRS